MVNFLPRQLDKESAKSIKKNVAIFAGGTSAMMIVQVVLQMSMNGALAEIIGKIVKFQLIVHLLLINTPSPANVLMFYKSLVPIVTFEVISTFSFFEKYMPDLDYEASYTPTFALFEYDLMYVLPLLGFLLITILALPLTWVFSSIGSCFKCTRCKTIRKKSRAVKKGLCCNGVIGLLYNAYLPITICCACNFFGNLANETLNEKINLYCCYALIGLVVIPLPIFTLVFYSCKFDSLGSKGF